MWRDIEYCKLMNTSTYVHATEGELREYGLDEKYVHISKYETLKYDGSGWGDTCGYECPTAIYRDEVTAYGGLLIRWKVGDDEVETVESLTDGTSLEAILGRIRRCRGITERFVSGDPGDGDAGTRIFPDGKICFPEKYYDYNAREERERTACEWTDIREVARGTFHTVGLKNDGTLVARGSNESGQCDIDEVTEPVRGVACGRFFTALLLESGKVRLLGEPEEELCPFEIELPRSEELEVEEPSQGWEKLNERLSRLSVGEELRIFGWNEVRNLRGEKLGVVCGGCGPMKRGLRVTVEAVTPNPDAGDDGPCATVTLRIEYEGLTEEESHVIRAWGAYEETPVDEWPPVVKIKGVFDAILGVTADGLLYVDGYCPMNEEELLSLMGAKAFG